MNNSDKNPLVSIIIPTFNRELFIEDTINSALSQDYENIEIIISDNCSTDKTNSIIEKFSHLKNIKHIKSNENIGPVKNWQKAINHTSGNYLNILFSDELLHPKKISILLNEMQSKNLDVSFSSVIIGAHKWQGDLYYKINNESGEISYLKYLFLSIQLGYGNGLPVSPSFFIFKKNLYQLVLNDLIRYYSSNQTVLDTGAGIDLLSILFTINASKKNVYYHETPLTFACAHPQSITHDKSDLVRSLDQQARFLFCNSF